MYAPLRRNWMTDITLYYGTSIEMVGAIGDHIWKDNCWLATLLIRWLHLITGAAWIGTSFYFNWLNHNIRPRKRNAKALAVNLWCMEDISIRCPTCRGTRRTSRDVALVQMGGLFYLDYRCVVTGSCILFQCQYVSGRFECKSCLLVWRLEYLLHR